MGLLHLRVYVQDDEQLKSPNHIPSGDQRPRFGDEPSVARVFGGLFVFPLSFRYSAQIVTAGITVITAINPRFAAMRTNIATPCINMLSISRSPMCHPFFTPIVQGNKEEAGVFRKSETKKAISEWKRMQKNAKMSIRSEKLVLLKPRKNESADSQ